MSNANRPPLRVLHGLWSAGAGGIERLVLDLATQQQATGQVAPQVLLGKEQGAFLERYRRAGFPLHAAHLRGGFDLSPRKLRRIVRHLRACDVVHLHTFNWLFALGAVLARRPVVYTVHGGFGFGRKRRLRDRLRAQALGYFLRRHVAHVTMNSGFAQEVARARFGLGGVPQSVVYNGAVLPAATPAEAPAPDLAERLRGCFVVGTAGRLVEMKRFDRLIEAFAAFVALDAGAAADARLLILGDGHLRGALEAQAARRGVAERTLFAGYRGDVAACWPLMDVCVFPSRHESFGLVALEALAHGRPVVVFADGGGLVEVVAPLAADDVVADEAHLARRLAHYRSHPARPEQAEACRRHAARFDIAHAEARFRKIYHAVCAGPASAEGALRSAPFTPYHQPA